MDKFTTAAKRFFAFGAGLSMALVFVIIFVNALRRYTMGKSIAWGEELPIYLTIYGVMFGIAYAYMSDSHIRFSIIADMLSQRLRHWLFVASDLLAFATGVVLAFAGHAFALRRGHIDSSGLKSAANALAETTGIPLLEWIGKLGTWQYAIAIGGVLLAVAAALKLLQRLRTAKMGNL
ncbi:TRAP transporter small permease subunit [Phaeobacter sp. PT47_59]|uniref:TRAP transporter small permease n=1 Tax=Phaeobacter sp. PT47_59 TaxID=3029979 RepID=UPI0023809E80|nr:TRAP transporter small permease subunit [Phaeobacter sp. PT47_59]MDE4176289.1 TRAP transporter small permease subunit [Phaeobacter sp. PT47_59]